MSTLNVSNITDGTDTVETGYVVNGSAKAWVQFNAATPVISGSMNVSSLTDNGTGQYYTNWSSNMGNNDYAISLSGSDINYGAVVYGRSSAINAQTNRYYVGIRANNTTNPALGDPVETSVTIHGDLA